MATSITASDDGLFQLSVSADRVYTAPNFNEWLSSLAANGILTGGAALSTELECSGSSGTMDTDVAIGTAAVQGHVMIFDSGGTITHTTADVTNPRIDLIVLEKNTDAGTRSDTFKLVTGTPAATPAETALTQSATIWQEKLCAVLIPANETDADNFTYTDYREESAILFLPSDNSIAFSKLVALGTNLVTITNASGEIVASAVTSTELGYLSGATSSIQGQIGTLSSLDTTAKTNLVVAVNEVAGRLPLCVVRRGSSSQVNNELYAKFDVEDVDTDSMFAPLTSETDFTIPAGQGGDWQICYNGYMSVNTAISSSFNEYGQIEASTSGTTIVHPNYYATSSGISSWVDVSFSAILPFVASETIKIKPSTTTVSGSDTKYYFGRQFCSIKRVR